MNFRRNLKKGLRVMLVLTFLLNLFGPMKTDETARAENLSGVYTKTFTISAYYSPLPCQDRYVTGTYKGDVRLNGSGINGADGTPVYPGMIAAPSSYPFGTKMSIPGIGTVAVHDRGGAIVENDGTNGIHDRLDIWMGFGDKGLERALNWGKRNVDVTVYGVNRSIAEKIFLTDYSKSEAVPADCSYSEVREPKIYSVNEHEENIPEGVKLSQNLWSTLQVGNKGDAVRTLQTELNRLNFYKGPISGNFDELTKHAVFKFQQSQGIVADNSSLGAGVFGPRTKDKLNEIINSRNYTKVLVATTTQKKGNLPDKSTEIAVQETQHVDKKVIAQKHIDRELDFGVSGPNVKILQDFLVRHGYSDATIITNYFGEQTKKALLAFQIDQQIIQDESDTGAGRVGPATLAKINSYL